eukprot:TRINITY_DN7811_c0_g1_i2.p1 TRINITY_DN7811_c0_g1~~TRINITY_DN7811_c0_g1_i2.p1  ORF type:complete len:431 (-),score=43.68 TRINITY_DN7811_c0_g1_i2:455-1747(-)
MGGVNTKPYGESGGGDPRSTYYGHGYKTGYPTYSAPPPEYGSSATYFGSSRSMQIPNDYSRGGYSYGDNATPVNGRNDLYGYDGYATERPLQLPRGNSMGYDPYSHARTPSSTSTLTPHSLAGTPQSLTTTPSLRRSFDGAEAFDRSLWSRPSTSSSLTMPVPSSPAAYDSPQFASRSASRHEHPPMSFSLRPDGLSSPSMFSQTPASTQMPVRESRPLLIWDWDDTLMCSSAINSQQLMDWQVRQLGPLIEQALTLSMRLGDTYIVTNADEQWVQASTQRFAPSVAPLLSRIQVLSARRRWEHLCPGDMFAWKRETFKEVLANRNTANGLNLIALGDSQSEMEASHTSTAGLACHPLIVKTVKFKENPSANDVLDQLRVILQELGQIVTDSRSGNRDLFRCVSPSSWQQGILPMAPMATAPQLPLLRVI